MGNFFAELKRRHIYRVGAAYVVVAWVLTQVIEILAQVFTLPLWIAQTAIVVLAIGFPVALIVAWMIESKPHEAVASAVRSKNTAVDWTLCGALAIVLLLIGYQQIAPRQVGVETARSASFNPRLGISLAVLPFANLSGDEGQVFFSDGITEEITTAIARIPDLRVVARTSAFEFKGQNRNVQTIGQQLQATHLIEGSVRKAGERVRITAQLINAADGTQIWSQNYDRELTDVFAIQEDIATAIAASLRMPLGLNAGDRLITSRNIDPESYQQYLRAKPLVRALAQGVPQAIEILEPLVARNPDYAPALALLADAYILTPTYHRNRPVAELRRIVDEFLAKGETAARRALQLDPNLADGYFALARLEGRRGKYLSVDELFSKGLALDPNHPAGLNNYSSLLAVLGRLKQALAMKLQVVTLEPFTPGFKTAAAEMLWLNGQDDAAISILKEVPAPQAKANLAEIYAALGRYGEAADILQDVPAAFKQVPTELIADPVRLLRSIPERHSPQSLPRLGGTLGFVYLHVGAPERVLDRREDTARAGYFSSGGTENAFLWHSTYAPVRKTERFKAWVRTEGMVEYWRAKGWPEFCRPVGAEDFECE
jgi:TolB-like protein